jgi:hypothetical protein
MAKLDKIKNLWKKANENKSKGGSFDELEDGRYLTVITDAEVGESKSSDRLQIMIAFKVQEGELTGKTKRAYYGLDTEMGVQIAVQTLFRLGIEVEDPSELEDKLKEAKGKIVKIQLKTKAGKDGNDYQNVFILKVMGMDEKEAAEGGAAGGEAAEEVEEPAVETTEEVELKVGMEVAFNFKKEELNGVVLELDEKLGKALIQTKDKKKYRISSENILLK